MPKPALCFVVACLLMSNCTLTRVQPTPDTTLDITPPTSDASIQQSAPGNYDFGVPTTSYMDTIVGFSFSYPAGWAVHGVDNPNAVAYAITLFSYDPDALTAPRPQSEIPAGEIKLDIMVHPDEIRSADDLLAQMRLEEQGGDTQILSLSSVTLTNGTPAYLLHINSNFGGAGTSLLTTIKGRGLSISGAGEQTLLILAIADSVQPV